MSTVWMVCYVAHLVPVLIADIDECILSLDNCSPLQECVDTPGSFVCNCLAGYTRLDGQDGRCIGELSIAVGGGGGGGGVKLPPQTLVAELDIVLSDVESPIHSLFHYLAGQ